MSRTLLVLIMMDQTVTTKKLSRIYTRRFENVLYYSYDYSVNLLSDDAVELSRLSIFSLCIPENSLICEFHQRRIQ